MRYLTIRRNKSFVVSFLKIKIYVEDPTSNEFKINGMPCRKIGELKNGEQKTFLISDDKLRIHVIEYSLDKNFSSDFYEIPAGTENVFLSGKCIYHPFLGDVFRFDGIPTEEMKYLRKKRLKNGIVAITLFLTVYSIILASFLIPYFSAPKEKPLTKDDASTLLDTMPKEKVFTKGGMSITLDETFTEEDLEEADAVYTSSLSYVVAFMVHDTYEEYKDVTVDEYSNQSILINERDAETKHKDGLTYYEYDADSSYYDLTYHYVAFIYKPDDSFYLVQFAVKKEWYSKCEEDIFKYAKSVSFNK